MSIPSFPYGGRLPSIDDRSAAWDARFASPDFTYGADPNAFVREKAHLIEPGSSVVDLGAGEGRNAVWLAEHGYAVTAIDVSEVGLSKAQVLARQRGVRIEARRADLAYWEPDRQWDAAVCTFLHMRIGERLHFYRAAQSALRAGGLFVAEWFRPEQRTMGYRSGGPPMVDYLIDAAELEQHFRWGTIIECRAADVTLAEGIYHQGPAAVVRLVFRKTNAA